MFRQLSDKSLLNTTYSDTSDDSQTKVANQIVHLPAGHRSLTDTAVWTHSCVYKEQPNFEKVNLKNIDIHIDYGVRQV